MHDLEYAVKNFSYTIIDPSDSFATRADRRKMLLLLARQLVGLGYKQLDYRQLKGRHIHALLRLWQTQALSTGTIKNRMAVLRWWAYHIGKPGLVPNANDALGIPKRTYVAETSKAIVISAEQWAKLTDAFVVMSLWLQIAFGVRRAEAILIRPHQADKGEWLILQPSWCKGGRARSIPVRTQEQRSVLDAAKAFVPTKTASLIPGHKTYAEQLHTYEHQLRDAGIHKAHGLRHAYAARRFEELTGYAAPVLGGPSRKDMTQAQRGEDTAARLVVSAELGHNREQITHTYIGT